MISIKQLCKKFEDKCVLDHIDLTLGNESKIYMLTGASGSGKTTLLNIIFGLDQDFTGQYELFGKNSLEYTEKEWSAIRTHEMKLVFQDYKLIEAMTVYENLALSGDFAEEEINQILKEMDVYELKEAFVKNISGGQKQRVAIARAVLGNPKIILLDEPTGNLDGLTTEHVMTYIKRLQKLDISFFIVTHDQTLLPYADQIFELKNGKLQGFNPESEDNMCREKFQTLEISNEKPLAKYGWTSLFRRKKRMGLLGIPVIIILFVFILSFTSFRTLSFDSFKNFYRGIGERTILVNTQKFTNEAIENFREQNIVPSHDGKRLAFSEADIEKVASQPEIQAVHPMVEGLRFYYDHEGNRFDYRADFSDAVNYPIDTSALEDGASVVFKLESLAVPQAFISHYNYDHISLLAGRFPDDQQDEILIPNLFAIYLSETKSPQDMIGQSWSANVISMDNREISKEYKIVGIYDTRYKKDLKPQYPIYTSYFTKELEPYDETIYQYSKTSAATLNPETEAYSKDIFQSYESFLEAMGTGYDQMIVVAETSGEIPSLYQRLRELFPIYQLNSHYDFEHGDMSEIYQNLRRKATLGFVVIALIVGIIIAFLNKGYIFDRTKEFATLYCLGYSQRQMSILIAFENFLSFTCYFIIAYILAFFFQQTFLNQTAFDYLFQPLISLEHMIILYVMLLLILLVSVIWGIFGVRNRQLSRLLKTE